MIITTTPAIDGRRVSSYLGVISADVITGANLFRDFFASVRDMVGGRVRSYEQLFAETKDEALRDLAEKAAKLGADAVVGVDLDYEIIGGDRKTILMIAATGTAVKLA